MKSSELSFFWPIVGHKIIINFIQQTILNNNISHAYLFVGTNHLGKATLAKLFAKSLQCEKSKIGDSQSKEVKLSVEKNIDIQIPCNECPSCQQIENNTHPDTLVFADKEKIKIEQVRNLQHQINLKPYNAENKICIIKDVERLTSQAANCLLKTLEEPPEKSLIILTTSGLNCLLPTIVSRCQIIKFYPVSTSEIKKKLKEKNIDENLISTICLISAGRPGIAFNIADQPQLFTKQIELVNELVRLVSKSRLEQMNFVDNLIKNFNTTEGFLNLESIMDFWLGWFRDLLLIRQECGDLILNFSEKDNLSKQAQNYSSEQIKYFIFEISEVKENLKKNINPKLLLENLIFSLS